MQPVLPPCSRLLCRNEGSRPHSPSCSVRSPPTSPTKVMYRQHATRELNDTPHRSQGSLSSDTRAVNARLIETRRVHAG